MGEGMTRTIALFVAGCLVALASASPAAAGARAIRTCKRIKKAAARKRCIRKANRSRREGSR
jgi:hypothetical protein